MSLFSAKRPGTYVVVAEAHFDGGLEIHRLDVPLIEMDALHDLILQARVRVHDTPGHEYWRLVFSAGLGPDGAAEGPAIYDLVDRRGRLDNDARTLAQRLRLPPGAHDVAISITAHYSKEPWDNAMEHRDESDRLDTSVRVIVRA